MKIIWILFIFTYIHRSKNENSSLVTNSVDGNLSDRIVHRPLYRQADDSANCENKNARWFKLKMLDLKQKNLVNGWLDKMRPIQHEYVYMTHCLLLKIGWIEERYIDKVKGKGYYFINEDTPLNYSKQYEKQTFFYDVDARAVTSDYYNNPRNPDGSLRLNSIDFFFPIMIESFEYYLTTGIASVFNSLFFRNDLSQEFFARGTFDEFRAINYNEFPSNVSSIPLFISRRLLDYHYQKKNEMDIFGYKKDFYIMRQILAENRTHYILDSYDYSSHLGRFHRFPENVWLMFLKFRANNGGYFRPYRLFVPDAYHQEEQYFYALNKEQVQNFFGLDKKDKGYLKIFHKVEAEKADANEVWVSDKILGYLEHVKSDPNSIDYSKLVRKSYDEMLREMCEVRKDKLVRLITTPILVDYSPFLVGRLEYQLTFNSILLLRWTCFSLNEDDCMYKTYSIVCRYLLKNHPAKWFPTNKTDTWVGPIRSNTTETQIPLTVSKTTKLFTINGTKNEFARLYYPNALFKYSSARRPDFDHHLQVAFALSIVVFFIKQFL